LIVKLRDYYPLRTQPPVTAEGIIHDHVFDHWSLITPSLDTTALSPAVARTPTIVVASITPEGSDPHYPSFRHQGELISVPPAVARCSAVIARAPTSHRSHDHHPSRGRSPVIERAITTLRASVENRRVSK